MSTSQSPLLSPSMKSTDQVDFIAPFSTYIQNAYQEDPSKYLGEINTLNKLRIDMTDAGNDLTGRDILYRYYGQLDLLDLRFPIDEKNIKISFNWYDAFTGVEVSQYSVAYEKACVIFNIATVCAKIAQSQNRFEPAQLKLSFNYLQCAAGLYNYINDNFLHAPSVDLSRDSIKAIVDIMLAQAQECFIEKVLMEKKKGSIVSKLAAQCSNMYSVAGDGMQEESVKGQFDKHWFEIVKIKAKYFQALAHYHKTLNDKSQKYGEDIAHLTVGETLAKEAYKAAQSFGSGGFFKSEDQTSASSALMECTKVLLNLLTERKVSSIKDNDLIYHDLVPNLDTLNPIEKVNATKQLAFADICQNGASDIPNIIGPDIFQKLVPLSVHESSSMYSEEKAKILRSQQNIVDAANQELQATLDSMNVVSTLDKLKKSLKNGMDNYGLHLPNEALGWCSKVRGEGAANIDELAGVVEVLKKRIAETMDECGLQLDKEQHDCETLRSKYLDKWTQPVSATLTSKMRQDLNQNRNTFEKAKSTDSQLFSRILDSQPVIDILKRPIEEVEAVFASKVLEQKESSTLIDGDGFNVLGEQVMIEKLEGLVHRLQLLKKERNEVLNELKEKIHNDDISSLLLLNKNRESQVFQAELVKFKTQTQKISNTLNQQKQLLSEASKEIEKLVQTSVTFKNLEKKESKIYLVLKEWKKGFDLYKEALEGLTNGVEFYSNLQEIIESLKKEIFKFVNNRTEERVLLIKRIDDQQAEIGQRVLKDQLYKLSINNPGATGSVTSNPATSPYVNNNYSVQSSNAKPAAALYPSLNGPLQGSYGNSTSPGGQQSYPSLNSLPQNYNQTSVSYPLQQTSISSPSTMQSTTSGPSNPSYYNLTHPQNYNNLNSQAYASNYSNTPRPDHPTSGPPASYPTSTSLHTFPTTTSYTNYSNAPSQGNNYAPAAPASTYPNNIPLQASSNHQHANQPPTQATYGGSSANQSYYQPNPTGYPVPQQQQPPYGNSNTGSNQINKQPYNSSLYENKQSLGGLPPAVPPKQASYSTYQQPVSQPLYQQGANASYQHHQNNAATLPQQHFSQPPMPPHSQQNYNYYQQSYNQQPPVQTQQHQQNYSIQQQQAHLQRPVYGVPPPSGNNYQNQQSSQQNGSLI
ncbi:bck1-like resistance to osmotic shock [Clydaea vesicula]|uniref:BRO domain-containing protein 1 n=1 Tax=Clydaea vesicula TaxID=447962 RepID=A0AAD5Y2Y9_9FUNG|nr:bck1-like resistance to osmotic shock [Clydaea vesicula]